MIEQYSLKIIRKHYTNLRKEVLRSEQKQSHQQKTKIPANITAKKTAHTFHVSGRHFLMSIIGILISVLGIWM